MTKTEREQLASFLALARGLLRQGSSRELLSLLDSLRSGDAPATLVALARGLQREVAPPPGAKTAADVRSRDDRFFCATLQCNGMSADACSKRQRKADAERNHSATYRGQGSPLACCETERCQDGHTVRVAIGDTAPVSYEPASPWQTLRRRRGGDRR